MHPSVLIFLLLFTLYCGEVLHAEDAPGVQDHPSLNRITGAEIIWGKVTPSGKFSIPVERVQWDKETNNFKATKVVGIEGTRTTLYYGLKAASSPGEALQRYEAELKAAGFEILFHASEEGLDDGSNHFVGRTFPEVKDTPALTALHQNNHEGQHFMALKGANLSGDPLYVSLYAFVLRDIGSISRELKEKYQLKKGRTMLRLDAVEPEVTSSGSSIVKAAAITQSLERFGHLAIYGLFFDEGKAALKAGSRDSLEEIAIALKAAVGKKFLIVAHTDNLDSVSSNQTLSMNRARAVAVALTKQYEVPAEKITPIGVGMSAPIASNANETGRSRNRRIEIVVE